MSTAVQKAKTLSSVLADAAASKSVFADDRSRKADNTLRRQDAELASFGEFIGRSSLSTNASKWEDISLGIVDAYMKHLLLKEYATCTINSHLSTY